MKLKILNKDGNPSSSAVFVKLIGQVVDRVLENIKLKIKDTLPGEQIEIILESGYSGTVSYPFFTREIFNFDYTKDITVWVPNEMIYDYCYKALPQKDKDIFVRYTFENGHSIIFIPGYAVRAVKEVYAKAFTSGGLGGEFTRSFQQLVKPLTKQEINREIQSGKTYFEFPLHLSPLADGKSRKGKISFGRVESVEDYRNFIVNVCNGATISEERELLIDISSGIIAPSVLSIEESVLVLYQTIKELKATEKLISWNVYTATATQVDQIGNIIGADT